MGENLVFRSWYYFRQGWSTYFAFIFAAVNTLTVTYFLAVDNYPELKIIFPSFEIYIGIISLIGVPLLVLIGYLHYKKSAAYRSEADIIFEVNPFVRRMLVNTELLIKLNLQLTENMIASSKNQKNSEDEIKNLKKLKDELQQLIDNRSFSNKMDLEYLKKNISTK
jgi:hypothetical protein|tara:strand:+ start:1305 stop:1802 length:498 start_codon:yes stop_codon:yes gene_type:complete